MLEPETPEHTNTWPFLLEGAIVGSEVRKGKSATYAALLLESLATESESTSGGEQQ